MVSCYKRRMRYLAVKAFNSGSSVAEVVKQGLSLHKIGRSLLNDSLGWIRQCTAVPRCTERHLHLPVLSCLILMLIYRLSPRSKEISRI